MNVISCLWICWLFLTVLPDRSMAFFTRPYVPFPRVCRNSYRCLRLCLWWCLFTAWRFAGAAAGSPGARPDPSPSMSLYTRADITEWRALMARAGETVSGARWSPALTRVESRVGGARFSGRVSNRKYRPRACHSTGGRVWLCVMISIQTHVITRPYNVHTMALILRENFPIFMIPFH